MTVFPLAQGEALGRSSKPCQGRWSLAHGFIHGLSAHQMTKPQRGAGEQPTPPAGVWGSLSALIPRINPWAKILRPRSGLERQSPARTKVTGPRYSTRGRTCGTGPGAGEVIRTTSLGAVLRGSQESNQPALNRVGLFFGDTVTPEATKARPSRSRIAESVRHRHSNTPPTSAP